jgi:hypothetical protein
MSPQWNDNDAADPNVSEASARLAVRILEALLATEPARSIGMRVLEEAAAQPPSNEAVLHDERRLAAAMLKRLRG